MKPLLDFDTYYHIFNKCIDKNSLFRSNEDFKYFIKIYSIYIEPVAETFAYCLLNNHFHLLIKTLPFNKLGYLNPEFKNSDDKTKKWSVVFPNNDIPEDKIKSFKKPNSNSMFAHLFDAYARYYNLKYSRRGRLFEDTFQRKEIDNEKYLRNIIRYIHFNPVHHKLTKKPELYKWTSYHSVVSNKSTRLKREEVLSNFKNQKTFIDLHKEYGGFDEIQHLIIE